MSNDFGKIEQSKQRMRRRLAALPYGQKLQILDELRGEPVVRLAEEVNDPTTTAAHDQEKPHSLLLEFINQTVHRDPRRREVTAGSDDEKTLEVEIAAMFEDRGSAV